MNEEKIKKMQSEIDSKDEKYVKMVRELNKLIEKNNRVHHNYVLRLEKKISKLKEEVE